MVVRFGFKPVAASNWTTSILNFPQLLDDPFRGRMSSHVAMQNLSPTMLDD
jgi:hypothetical protein